MIFYSSLTACNICAQAANIWNNGIQRIKSISFTTTKIVCMPQTRLQKKKVCWHLQNRMQSDLTLFSSDSSSGVQIAPKFQNAMPELVTWPLDLWSLMPQSNTGIMRDCCGGVLQISVDHVWFFNVCRKHCTWVSLHSAPSGMRPWWLRIKRTASS